jgi:tripartite-type tricarboxylate transporter receptor subunit TctC
MSFTRRHALALLAAAAGASRAAAEEAADFYKNKTISILVGAGEGGTFIPYAQLLADHIKRHIPGNPTIIVKTMGGQGGGLETAILMSNTASRDGLTWAMTQSTIVMAQVLNPEYAKYDARTWSWLGNMAPLPNMIAVWHTAKAQSVEEAKRHEVIVGATGPSSPTYILPDFLNKYAGTKFKIVTGYRGPTDLNLAMERGETEGRGGSWVSLQVASPHYIAENKIKPIVFASPSRDPGHKGVPTLAEVVVDPRHKKAAELISSEAPFTRAFFLPPGVPVERVAALRKAFEAAMADPALLEEAAKKRMPIEPTWGPELDRITAEVIATPADILQLAK